MIPVFNLCNVFDKTAFIELLTLDNVLVDRYLYKKVGYPSNLKRFNLPDIWLDFGKLQKIDEKETINDFVIGLVEIIQNSVGDDDVLIPISGGLDSRILLACASSVLKPERIHCVTFCGNVNNLEVSIAKRICKTLSIKDHKIHVLTPNVYKHMVSKMANMTGGHISSYHCHLLSYLIDNQFHLPPKLISGIFADAVAGYACNPNESKVRDLLDTSVYKKFEKRLNMLSISVDSAIGVVSDFELIWKQYQENNFNCGFSEYYYFTQRNKNFLLGLASLYSRFCENVILPYSEPTISSLLVSLPIDYRINKMFLRRTLQEMFPELSKIMVYSSSDDRESLKGKLFGISRKLCTGIGYGIDALTADKVPLWNPWQNEIQGRFLRSYFENELLKALHLIQAGGMISEKTANILKRKKYLSWYHQAQFHCLALGSLVDNFIVN